MGRWRYAPARHIFRTMADPKRLSRRGLLGLATLSAGFALGSGSAFVTRMAMRHQGEFLPGTRVGGVDISGLTPRQAVVIFDNRWREYLDAPVIFQAPDRDWIPTAAEIGIALDYLGPMRRAYEWGRTGGIFKRGREQASAVAVTREFPMEFSFERGKLRRYLAAVASIYFQQAVDATMDVRNGDIRMRPSNRGFELDWEAAVELVQPPGPNSGPQGIVIPIRETVPAFSSAQAEAVARRIESMVKDPLVLEFENSGWLVRQEALRDALMLERTGGRFEPTFDHSRFSSLFDEIDRTLAIEPLDAAGRFDEKASRVTDFAPPRDGRKLDRGSLIDGILTAAKGEYRTVDIPIVGISASRAATNNLGIETLIGSGESFFFQSAAFRIHNIEVGSRTLNGSLIKPGDRFSFNEYLGPIDYDRGFVDGLVIVEDSTVDGIGGGICQVSTTLFRAAFWAGLPIEERHKHLYRVRYYEQGDYPIGFDASIWQPSLDMRFQNDTDGPVMVRTIFDLRRSSLKFELWGRSTGRTVEISDHRLSDWVDPPEDQWYVDDELPEGTKKQTEWAVQGVFAVLSRKVWTDTVLIADSDFASSFVAWPNRFSLSPDVAQEIAPEAYEDWIANKAVEDAEGDDGQSE